jgi:regulator of replication initiation timing
MKGITEMTDEQYMRIVSDPQYIQISDLRDENDRLRAENEALKAKLESGLWFSAVEVAEIGTMINTAKRLQAENEEWRQINDSTDFEYKKLKAELDVAKRDLRISNKCITCIHNTGREGKDWCNNPNKGVRFANRKEDRYIRCECCGWEWRGLCAENGGNSNEKV